MKVRKNLEKSKKTIINIQNETKIVLSLGGGAILSSEEENMKFDFIIFRYWFWNITTKIKKII